MPFVTYENYRNPRITIHSGGCNQIAKRGGEQKHGQAKYRKHISYDSARQYAGGTGLPIIVCSYCSQKAPVAVRILPMNLDEFPDCADAKDVQQKFFLNRLPLKQNGRYRYKKRSINAQPGTVVLFQCENAVIASAIFRYAEPFEQPDRSGYEGALMCNRSASLIQ